MQSPPNEQSQHWLQSKWLPPAVDDFVSVAEFGVTLVAATLVYKWKTLTRRRVILPNLIEQLRKDEKTMVQQQDVESTLRSVREIENTTENIARHLPRFSRAQRQTKKVLKFVSETRRKHTRRADLGAEISILIRELEQLSKEEVLK